MTSPATAGPSRHVWPLVFLGILVCIYYLPQLATGTVQYDGVDVHYSSQRYFSDTLRSGRLPFWTPDLFSGFPFLADLQVGAWYPLNWPFFLAGITPSSISLELLLHSLIACAGAYALALRLLGPAAQWSALGAAMFYGLSGWFAAHSQHVGMFQTAAWLPWLVLSLDGLGQRLSVPKLALASLLGAAVALPGHFQVALYAFSGAGLWALLDAILARAWGRARQRLVGLLAVALGGAALSAVMILPALELVGLSLRTRLNARELDLGYFRLESLLTLIQPDHFGLLAGNYHGPGDVTQHYFYAGIALVPLAMLGVRNPPAVRMALLLGIPFLWYALGPTGGLFRAIVRLPGFSSVELPMHGWFLPALGLALLGGAGLSVVAARLPRHSLPVFLVVLFVDALTVNQLLNPLAYARQSFAVLYGAPLESFRRQLDTAQPPVQRLYGPPLTAVGYRNHPLQSHVETTYGYNPLELANYADYADAAEANPRLIDGFAATHRLADNLTIRPMANPLPPVQPAPGPLPSPSPLSVAQATPSPLLLAFFARRLASVPDAATATVRLTTLDPAAETIVIGPLPDIAADAAAEARVVARSDDSLTIQFRSPSANLLRVAIPAYPGWHATLNGVELPIVSADLAFQGVVVPAGEGVIHLDYIPRLFGTGSAISTVAVLVCLAVLRGAVQGNVGRRRVWDGTPGC